METLKQHLGPFRLLVLKKGVKLPDGTDMFLGDEGARRLVAWASSATAPLRAYSYDPQKQQTLYFDSLMDTGKPMLGLISDINSKINYFLKNTKESDLLVLMPKGKAINSK